MDIVERRGLGQRRGEIQCQRADHGVGFHHRLGHPGRGDLLFDDLAHPWRLRLVVGTRKRCFQPLWLPRPAFTTGGSGSGLGGIRISVTWVKSHVTAWVRFFTPILFNRFLTWTLTVASAQPSAWAIRLFWSPRTSIPRTSFSRSVNGRIRRPDI